MMAPSEMGQDLGIFQKDDHITRLAAGRLRNQPKCSGIGDGSVETKKDQ